MVPLPQWKQATDLGSLQLKRMAVLLSRRETLSMPEELGLSDASKEHLNQEDDR